MPAGAEKVSRSVQRGFLIWLETPAPGVAAPAAALTVGVCGFTFGPTDFPVADGSQTLDFPHTSNLNTPEPST